MFLSYNLGRTVSILGFFVFIAPVAGVFSR
jgi:hypothetical protein